MSDVCLFECWFVLARLTVVVLLCLSLFEYVSCRSGVFVFFFFKQKPAYDIWYGLVGSEMCIRDSGDRDRRGLRRRDRAGARDPRRARDGVAVGPRRRQPRRRDVACRDRPRGVGLAVGRVSRGSPRRARAGGGQGTSLAPCLLDTP